MNHQKYGGTGNDADAIQGVLAPSRIQRNKVLVIFSRLFFSVPERYDRRLNEVWQGNSINEVEWEVFAKATLVDWQGSRQLSFVIFMMNVLTGQPYYRELSIITTVTSLLCAICATCLVTSHGVFVSHDSALVLEYLSKAYNPSNGFQTRAVIFSLPQALMIWTILATTLNVYSWILSDITGLENRLVVFVSLGIITVGLSAWGMVKGCMAMKRGAVGTRDLEKA